MKWLEYSDEQVLIHKFIGNKLAEDSEETSQELKVHIIFIYFYFLIISQIYYILEGNFSDIN